MTGKKEEIDRAVKEKLAPKQFTKTPINGTKFRAKNWYLRC